MTREEKVNIQWWQRGGKVVVDSGESLERREKEEKKNTKIKPFTRSKLVQHT